MPPSALTTSLLLLMLLLPARAWAQSPQTLSMGAGTGFETPVLLFEGPAPGPTLLVQACIHGNEPAGALALDALKDKLKLSSGRLVLIPRLHKAACQKNRRFITKDLNRQFPGHPESPTLEARIAAANMALIKRFEPALILTLHEASTRHTGAGSKGLAGTLITGRDPLPKVLLDVIRHANGHIRRQDRHFKPLLYPVDHSSSEVYVETFGCQAFAVETWLRDPMDLRVSLHKAVVLGALEALGIEHQLVP